MTRIIEKKRVLGPNHIAALLSKGKTVSLVRTDETMQSKSNNTFRALSWSDVAVPLPEPVEEVDAPEDANTHDDEDRPVVPAELDAVEMEPELTPDAAIEDAEEAAPEAPAIPQVPAIDEAELQRIRDDAYAEGLSAGKAMTESEREEELAAKFQQLEQVIARLGADDLIDTQALSERIQASVLELTSQRVGFILEDVPEVMTMRITALMADFAHLAGLRELFVSPEDLALVQEGFDAQPDPTRLQLRSDPALARGDARLRVGGAEISDTLTWTEDETLDDPSLVVDA